MNRRALLATLAGWAAWPVGVGAQSVPLIGFVSSRSAGESASVVGAFRKGLTEGGLAEGRDYRVEFRWADGRYEILSSMAAELLGLNASLLFAAGSTPAALAAKGVTSTVPIVFSGAPDPVGVGLVDSLQRPGGNVTGMSTVSAPLGAKLVQILKEAIPKAAAFAFLGNPTNPSANVQLQVMIPAGRAAGVELVPVTAKTEEELEHAFESLRGLMVDGVVVQPDPFFDSVRERVVAAAARRRIPAAYLWRENAAAGGLVSYGPSIADSYRRAGLYAARILKGERAADLPVMQPDKFELVINLRAAKELGLDIPPSLLARADEVIE